MKKSNTSYTDGQAEAYNSFVSMEVKFHQLFMSKLNPYVKPGDTCIDLGCGDFYLSPQYFQMGFSRVTGIDASTPMLKKATAHEPRLETAQATLPAIPFSRGSVDIVTTSYFLQNLHPSQMKEMYQEVWRVLKPGGYFIAASKHPLQQWLKKLLDRGDKADYFKTEDVTLDIFDGALSVTEPSHTLNDYMSIVECGFNLLHFEEGYEYPASKRLMGRNYPTFFIVVAKKA